MMILLAGMMLAAMPAGAQVNEADKQPSLKEKVTGLWNKAKKDVKTTGKKLGEAIGLNDSSSYPHVDDVKIDGHYYMPLYTVELYKEADGQEFRDQCEALFKERYPSATVQTVRLPQTDWFVETVKRDGKIVGYTETLYCFIIARDGGDGYINAKFAFQQYKDVGHEYNHVVGKWPAWVRTDVLTNAVYEKLKDR